MWNVPPGSDYERFEDVSSLTSPAQVNVVAPWGCPPDQGLKPDFPDKDVSVANDSPPPSSSPPPSFPRDMWNVLPGSDYERFEDVSSLTSPAQVNVVAPWDYPPDQGLKPDCPDKDVSIGQRAQELETKSCPGNWTVADKGSWKNCIQTDRDIPDVLRHIIKNVSKRLFRNILSGPCHAI